MERIANYLGQGLLSPFRLAIAIPLLPCLVALSIFCCLLSSAAFRCLTRPSVSDFSVLLQAVGISSPDDLTYFNALDFLAKAQLIQNRMGGSNRLGEARFQFPCSRLFLRVAPPVSLFVVFLMRAYRFAMLILFSGQALAAALVKKHHSLIHVSTLSMLLVA
jgi:hypothetical protein